ncbi:venom protease-like [Chironomus tepperi]|uniref:venom protease-like n=1 Tax=Chironomus tepperi TaxID=113505 RepID=UPI00391F326B
MKVSIFILSLLFCFVKCDDSLPCRFSDGSFGKCVEIRNCKSLLTQYRNGTLKAKDMPICDSVRRLVCCPRISTKKCREYGKNALEIARIPSLLLHDDGNSYREIVVKTKCTHVPVSLIVGGEEAKVHEFPHQALLGYQKNETVEWLCGGSLISPDFVLTAAHCLSLSNFVPVKYVKLGVNDRQHDTDKTILSIVSQTFKPPRGDYSSSHSDIALLKLQEPVKLSEFILPICMPTRPFYDNKGIVSGFGENGKGILTQRLMKVVLEKFDHKNCKGSFEKNYNEDTMLCYGHHTQRKDSCTGDSG